MSVLCGRLGVMRGVTAVIGSGGKTSLLRYLGEELRAAGRTVILCATTKIYPFQGLPCLADAEPRALREAVRRCGLICVGTPTDGGKWTASRVPVAALAELADCVLAECDGAARRPLKAHAPHEPAIPAPCGRVICVAGLGGLGRPIVEAAHRPERYAALAGADVTDAVTPQIAARVLNAEALGDIYFLNQADDARRRAGGEALRALAARPAVIGSLWKGEFLC